MALLRNLLLGSAALLTLPALLAQEAAVTSSPVSVVPHVIKYSGSLPQAPAAASVVEVKFALYGSQSGGDALWSETQQVALDPQSRYSVLLGSTTAAGLPHDLFASGAARWLGVALAGAQESPRTLLTANAYAVKAADAETLGGHPAADFVLANPTANGKPDAAVDITTIDAGNQGITVSGNGTATVTIGLNMTYIDSLGAQFAVLKASNAFTGNQSITGNLLSSGTFTTLNGTSKIAAGAAVDIAYANGIYTISLDGNQGEAFGNGLWAQLKAANTFTMANTFNGGITANSLFNNVYSPAQEFNTSISNTASQGGGITISSPVLSLEAFATNTTAGEQSIAIYGASESADGRGVEGVLPTQGGNGAAIYGILGAASAIGATVDGEFFQAPAIWADSSDQTSGTDRSVALLATADSDNAAVFENNSGTYFTVFAVANDPSGTPLVAYNASTGDTCTVDADADITCSGSITGAITPVRGGNTVAVHAITSPENWIEDFGSGALASGSGHVDLEPVFLSTVNTGVDYHVFLSPEGDCKGLYVANKTANSFDVREIGGGNASIAFSYRIVAKRIGMESARLEDLSKSRQMLARQMAKRTPHAARQVVRVHPHGTMLTAPIRPH